MPTPFMHIALAQRLISDAELPSNIRTLLTAEWGAFLLGGIAPDARVSSGMDRGSTHFFEYGPTINPPPVEAMLSHHPDLKRAALHDNTRAAFVAGYTAHLTVDAVWSTDLLYPIFVNGGDWAPQPTKFLVLHALLASLDRHDRQLLLPSDYDKLAVTTPNHWLPFMSDEALTVWRDTVASQLAPGAESLTTEILGKRVSLTAAELTAFIDDEAQMNHLTWANVPPDKLAVVEETMYTETRATVIAYLDEPS
ncbi:MAG: zinc dependent phospholipase C family protein [Chloroflexota bacterium]